MLNRHGYLAAERSDETSSVLGIYALKNLPDRARVGNKHKNSIVPRSEGDVFPEEGEIMQTITISIIDIT